MKKILIIEDDKVVSNIYRNKLGQAGFDVMTALDGETGLKMLEEFKPDLVQLDLMLPKVNGVEIIKHIRATEQLKFVPIIVLSNHYVPELTRDAWKAGASKCVAKANCTPKLVQELIEELLSAPPGPRAPLVPAVQPAQGAPAPAAPPTQSMEEALAAMEMTSGKAHADLHRDFTQILPKVQADLRARTHALIKSTDAEAQLGLLLDLYRAVHTLVGYAGMAGFSGVAQLSGALEAFLKELHQRPKQITPSTLRTIASAVDCVGALLGQAFFLDDAFLHSTLIMAVDDEAMSRQALCTALGKASLRAVCADHPDMALKLLELNKVDLLFLDIELPGMDGFELCQRIRATPANKAIPVVFVTTQSNFQNRARSVLSGGNELIAKPFLLLELAVKALTILFKAKLPPPPTVVETPPPDGSGQESK